MPAVPAPRPPADNRCPRHPRYLLASCDTCRAVQTARLTHTPAPPRTTTAGR